MFYIDYIGPARLRFNLFEVAPVLKRVWHPWIRTRFSSSQIEWQPLLQINLSCVPRLQEMPPAVSHNSMSALDILKLQKQRLTSQIILFDNKGFQLRFALQWKRLACSHWPFQRSRTVGQTAVGLSRRLRSREKWVTAVSSRQTKQRVEWHYREIDLFGESVLQWTLAWTLSARKPVWH